MAQTTANVLAQLNQARQIVLANAGVYPQVVPGIIGVVGPNSHLDLRRWGADFLAETFASPVLAAEEKQKLCLGILDTLTGYLRRKEERGEEEDVQVVKSTVQCAASIYPLVFRHTVHNPKDDVSWSKMAGIKSWVLRQMDNVEAGVKICCIKFVARVVQVQTSGLISDPRRPEQNEISLALVPRDHPVIPPSNLEAEASGLLDRLLGVLQDNLTDALVVTATLNSLASLVHKRASVSNKIVTTTLNFNPLTLANGRLDGKDKVHMKSMARTTWVFLINLLKRNPQHPLGQRIQHRAEQLKESLANILAGGGAGKRKEPDEPTDGLDEAKRRRVETDAANGTTPVLQQQQQQRTPQPPTYPPLPPGPASVAQLFTLTQDPAAAGFHVAAIPPQLVAQLVPPLLQSIDQPRLDSALNAIRARYLQVTSEPPPSALDAAKEASGVEDEEDYDPSTSFPGQAQVMNQLDQLAPEGVSQDVAVGPFRLPSPLPLTEKERLEFAKVAQLRLFATLKDLDDQRAKGLSKKVEAEKGFNRLLAVGSQDREGWITLITRLATRGTYQLDDEDGQVKQEGDDGERAVMRKSAADSYHLPNLIREALKDYVITDFRRRIDVGIAWLSEEWYADRLALQQRQSSSGESGPPSTEDLPNYAYNSTSLLESLIPYLDVKDGRFLIRFLSEIPQLSGVHMQLVKKVADDPERVQVATQALLYLIMLRPPVRDMAVDAAVELWRENADAKAAAAKILTKWRPAVLKEAKQEGGGMKNEV